MKLLLSAAVTALFFGFFGTAHAVCPIPNPNNSAFLPTQPGVVDGCPMPASALNRIAPLISQTGSYSWGTWLGAGGGNIGYNPADTTVPATGYFNASGSKNGFVGQNINNVPYATTPFLAVGTTGFGGVPSGIASVAFGLYGLGELHNANGEVTNEMTVRNFSGGAAAVGVPPPLGLPSTNPIADGLQVTCGTTAGTSDCSTGVFIANEASSFTNSDWANGLIIMSYKNYGIYVIAQPSAITNATTAEFDNFGNGVNLVLKTTGSQTAANAVMTINKSDGTVQSAFYQNGDAQINNLTANGNTITLTGLSPGSGGSTVCITAGHVLYTHASGAC
jgi:hypothetical protein